MFAQYASVKPKKQHTFYSLIVLEFNALQRLSNTAKMQAKKRQCRSTALILKPAEL